MSMSSWLCKKCNFLNSPSQKPTCQMCLSPSSPSFSKTTSPSSSVPTSTCKPCTFLDASNNTNSQLFNTRPLVSSLLTYQESNVIDFYADLDSFTASVFLPLKTCSNTGKIRDQDQDPDSACFDVKEDTNSEAEDSNSEPEDTKSEAEDTKSEADLRSLKILSYNVWFREDLEMHKRMEAIGDLIQLHSPDFICFQEVTPNIYNILCQSSWWKVYQCSVSNEMIDSRPYFCMQLSKLQVESFSCKPFRNSTIDRELCIAEVKIEADKPLVIATSHLGSPCLAPPKWDRMFSKERVEQAKEAINLLEKNPNVIFCGDMNWDDKMDDPFPCPEGWVDAWTELRPGENGWTYDTNSNQMLSGNRTLQKRLDRCICNLRDFKISKIDMIGMEAIPGLLYCEEKKGRKEIKKLELPVLPSDHYGLLLTISHQ